MINTSLYTALAFNSHNISKILLCWLVFFSFLHKPSTHTNIKSKLHVNYFLSVLIRKILLLDKGNLMVNFMVPIWLDSGIPRELEKHYFECLWGCFLWSVACESEWAWWQELALMCAVASPGGSVDRMNMESTLVPHWELDTLGSLDFVLGVNYWLWGSRT